MNKLVLFFLLFPCCIYAQDRKTQITELMSAANIPGLSLAYIKNGKVHETYHLGVRSSETKEPVNESTVFAAASLSKSTFAYGVMKLVETGKLNLDTPLFRYLDYEDLKHDARYRSITARQVLSHTSGLPNWRNGPQLNFIFNPGERYSYSGEGFVLLSKVVEKITGQGIEEWMQQNVFVPLGMTNSSYLWKVKFDTNYAHPHMDFGKSSPKFFPKEANTAHSLQTTANDYAIFLAALLNGKGLKKNTWQVMFVPQANSRFKDYESSLGWGLGLGYATSNEGVSFWQWGDNGTFKAFVLGYPAKKEGLVFFANSLNGMSIASELIALFIKADQPELKWLSYAGYKDASFQLLRRAVSLPFSEAVQPYLQKNTTHHDTSLIREGQMNSIGNRLIQLQQFDQAISLYEMNLKAYPNSTRAYEGMGRAYLRLGKRAQAAAAFEQAYRKDTSRAYLIAAANRLNGKPDTTTGIPTTFRLAEYANARSVQLVGDFNQWNDIRTPMRWENGAWLVTVPLKAGEYTYKFAVDGIWLSDPKNPKVKTDGNLESIIEVKER
ncbi:MAG TPA: serine hydrolase [Chitinophagaceae bacterium]